MEHLPPLMIKVGNKVVIIRIQTMRANDGLDFVPSLVEDPHEHDEEHMEEDTEESEHSGHVLRLEGAEGGQDRQVDAREAHESRLDEPHLQQTLAALCHSDQQADIDEHDEDQEGGDQREDFVRLVFGLGQPFQRQRVVQFVDVCGVWGKRGRWIRLRIVGCMLIRPGLAYWAVACRRGAFPLRTSRRSRHRRRTR